MKSLTSFFPFLDLYRQKVVPGFTRNILRDNLTFFILFIFVAIFLLFTFGYSIIGNKLFELPDQERLFVIFFKEIFIPMICLMIAWYIISLKPNIAKLDEIRFLNSLSITHKKICFHFVFNETVRFSWVPGGLWLLYFMFHTISPKSFLIRLYLITFLLFCLMIAINIALHFKISSTSKRFQNINYPARSHPVILFLTIFLFVLIEVNWIVFPSLISGFGFFFVLIGFVLGLVVSIFWIFSVFNIWVESNARFKTKTHLRIKRKRSYRDIAAKLNKFLPLLKANPLLTKNVLQTLRIKTNFANTFLTLLLIIISYLIAMNNETIEDSLWVLLGLFLIYSLIFSVRAIQNFSEDIESTWLVYSFSLTKIQFYVSNFIPLFFWLFCVLIFLFFLVLVSGSSFQQASTFLLWSAFSIFIFLSIALNCGLAYYPDSKDGQMKFFYFLLAFVLLSSIFFKYVIWVAFFISMISFIPCRKAKMYSS